MPLIILGFIGCIIYEIYDELNPTITYINPVHGSNYTIEIILVICAILFVCWVIVEMQKKNKTPEQLRLENEIMLSIRNSWGHVYDRDGNIIGGKRRWIR